MLKVDWNPINNLIISGGEDCKYKVLNIQALIIRQGKRQIWPLLKCWTIMKARNNLLCSHWFPVRSGTVTAECCIPACCMNILLPVFRGLQMVSLFLFGLLNRYWTDILLLVSILCSHFVWDFMSVVKNRYTWMINDYKVTNYVFVSLF